MQRTSPTFIVEKERKQLNKKIKNLFSQSQLVFSDVTWSLAGLLLVNRYLKHTATVESDASSSPASFYPSGDWSVWFVWMHWCSSDWALTNDCPQSRQRGGDLWPLVQSANWPEGGRDSAQGRASGSWPYRACDRFRQDPDHRWDPRARKTGISFFYIKTAKIMRQTRNLSHREKRGVHCCTNNPCTNHR